MRTFSRDQWLLKPTQRRIRKQGKKWLLMDGVHVIGEFDTNLEARIERRRMEVGKR